MNGERDLAERKVRKPRATETMYRVVGFEFPNQPYARTWKYARRSDAEWRADCCRRRGRLVAFDQAAVHWEQAAS